MVLKIFVILGPSGCGKGTQAKLLAERFNIPATGMGEILRREYKAGTVVGMRAEKYWGKGDWVPDDLIFKILRPFLEGQDCQNGFVLEGFPRTVNQARILDNYLGRKGGRILKVFHLDTSDEISIRRIQEGLKKGTREVRPDDFDSALIKRRLASYRSHIRPILAYYGGRGLLERIDNEQPVEAVSREILSRIGGGED